MCLLQAGESPRYIVDSWVPRLDRDWSADLYAGHAVSAGAGRAMSGGHKAQPDNDK